MPLASEFAHALSAAARAKAAAARADAERQVRGRALSVAVAARSTNPGLSAARVAGLIKAALGGLVPELDTLRRWVRRWERTGDLPRAQRLGSCRADAQQFPASSCRVAPHDCNRPSPTTKSAPITASRAKPAAAGLAPLDRATAERDRLTELVQIAEANLVAGGRTDIGCDTCART